MKYLTVEEEHFVLIPSSLWVVHPPQLIHLYDLPPIGPGNQLLPGAQMFLPQLWACFPTCRDREIFKLYIFTGTLYINYFFVMKWEKNEL